MRVVSCGSSTPNPNAVASGRGRQSSVWTSDAKGRGSAGFLRAMHYKAFPLCGRLLLWVARMDLMRYAERRRQRGIAGRRTGTAVSTRIWLVGAMCIGLSGCTATGFLARELNATSESDEGPLH